MESSPTLMHLRRSFSASFSLRRRQPKPWRFFYQRFFKLVTSSMLYIMYETAEWAVLMEGPVFPSVSVRLSADDRRCGPEPRPWWSGERSGPRDASGPCAIRRPPLDRIRCSDILRKTRALRCFTDSTHMFNKGPEAACINK